MRSLIVPALLPRPTRLSQTARDEALSLEHILALWQSIYCLQNPSCNSFLTDVCFLWHCLLFWIRWMSIACPSSFLFEMSCLARCSSESPEITLRPWYISFEMEVSISFHPVRWTSTACPSPFPFCTPYSTARCSIFLIQVEHRSSLCLFDNCSSMTVFPSFTIICSLTWQTLSLILGMSSRHSCPFFGL